MTQRMFAIFLAIGSAASLLLMGLLPLGAVGAWQQPTPTVAPLSDFAIPTSTPGQSGFSIPTATPAEPTAAFVIPTATPGAGLVIPTSTPGVKPGFVVLADEQLAAINLQPNDVPAEFAANQYLHTFVTADMVEAFRMQGRQELADEAERIAGLYGWDRSAGVTYTLCQATIPITEIYSEVAQLSSPEAARAFVDDLSVQAFFAGLSYSLSPAENIHGWRAVLPAQPGTCFAQETEYSLFFEYWGLLVTLSMMADANTDPGLVNGLLDQLAAIIVAHADPLATMPLPPTPVPGTGLEVVPTQPPEPTAFPTLPLPTLPPLPTPVAATATPATAGATLADLERIMPTEAELGITAPFALNTELSQTMTLDQIVSMLNQLGLSELALATDQAGRRNGLIGQVARVWDTGSACPDTVGLSVEIDLALFQTPQGAIANVNDSGLQQAWINTGVISGFTPSGNGVLATGAYQHRCGPVMMVSKAVPHGRFVITVATIVDATAVQSDIISSIDGIASYMIEKLDQAGLK